MARQFVKLQNPKTGEIKDIKFGFDWVTFIFAGFLGIPLFLRKLWLWGGVMVALWAYQIGMSVYTQHVAEQVQAQSAVAELLGTEASNDAAMILFWLMVGQMIFSITYVAISIYLGRKVSKMTAIKLLEEGWIWGPQSESFLQDVKRQWNIASIEVPASA